MRVSIDFQLFITNFVTLGQNSQQNMNLELVESNETTADNDNDNKFSLTNYRFLYPEFVPDPNLEFRNLIREKLERYDMIARRMVIDIPEFYVGSILTVVCSDPHSEKKVSSFTGICIDRQGCGLRASIILRNVIDKQVKIGQFLSNIFFFNFKFHLVVKYEIFKLIGHRSEI